MKTVHELVRDGMAQEYSLKLVAEQRRLQEQWEAKWIKGFEGYQAWSEARHGWKVTE